MDIFEVKLIEVPDLFKVSIITGTSIIVNSDNTYNAIAYNGQTFVIPDTPWIDSDGTPMTSPATTPIVCSAPVGCDVENSDGTYDVHVNNGATLVIPDTTVKNTSGTTILVQPSATSTGVISDSVVTNSDATFSLNVPAESNPVLDDITHIDSDLTPVVLPAMTPMVCTPAATPEGWYPPADWGWDAASALINDGDNGFVALFMAFPGVTNYISFITYFSGTATIDWGDGTTDSVTSGAQKDHILDYDNIPGGIVTSVGCKLAVIKFEATSDLIRLLLHTPHLSLGTYYGQSYWLALKLRTDSDFYFRPSDTYGNRAEVLKLIDFGNCVIHNDSYLAFLRLRSLNKITWAGFTHASGVCTNNLFSYANLSAFDFSIIDWQYYTNWSSIFSYATNGSMGKLSASIDTCTTLYGAFDRCTAFHSVELTNTGSVNSIQSTLYQAFVTSFEMDDCSGVTSAANFIYPAAGYVILQKLILTGLTVGINIANGKMSATALNAFFTALGTAAGSQTITVTGNPGAATCDTSIATAKGFTVVT